MLVSGYDCDHRGGVDAALYRALVLGRLPIRSKLLLLAAATPAVRDQIRLLAIRLSLDALRRGRWRSISLPRPTTYRAAHPNLAADVAAVAGIAPIVNLDVAVEPAPAPILPAPGPFFTPPRSGFFSAVSAVLTQRFLRGDGVPINDWFWPYAVPLADIVGGPCMTAEAPADRLGPLREHLFHSPETHPAFDAFARRKHAAVFERCRNSLARHGIQLPPAGSHTVWFVRRGDKLAREALDVPVAAYVRSIDRIMGRDPAAAPLVVGDDDGFIAAIRRLRPWVGWFAGFPAIHGSTLAATVSLERTLALLANFCILCEARAVVGDSHCNLVAAAMAVRGDMAAADPELFPWTRHVLV
ncbi:MAG: hypothetical protein WED27_04590 [Pirellulales bacterium]